MTEQGSDRRDMAQRLRFSTARDLFDAFPAALEDMAARPSDRPSLDFIKELAAGPTPEDAITFCAYLLPSARRSGGDINASACWPTTLAARTSSMLALAEDWVRHPERSGATMPLDAGMAAPTKTPGVWIALAAGWSGGSMMGPDAAAGDAAALSDRQGRQCRRAQRAGAGRARGAAPRRCEPFVDMGMPPRHAGVSRRPQTFLATGRTGLNYVNISD